MKIVLATNNDGKVAEFNTLLDGTGISFIPQSEFALPSVAETGETFVENAIIKARYAAKHTDMPALADDSGLEVDALGGAPGVISSRYASDHDHAKNMAKVLEEMQKVPDGQRTARFHCVLALMRYPADPDPLICQGVWEGMITREPKGSKGFGYDPIFWVPSHQCTAAEMDAALKNTISHRALAMTEFMRKLKRIPAAVC